MRGKLAYRTGLIFILLVAFGLRIMDLANTPPGIYYDMGRYIQRIWRYNEGYGVLLYFQDIAEPFDFLIRAYYHRLTGGVNLFMSQMFTIWISMLGVAAFALCARVLYKKHPYRNLISLFAAFTLATMPTAVILGKHLFRANWLPLTIALTVTALVIAWRSKKILPAALSGFFMGLSTIFYTGGLLFPPAMALVVLVQLFIGGWTWKRIQQLFVMGIVFAVTMLPWLYYFIRVPNWLSRVGDLSEGASPLSNPSLLTDHIRITISTIFIPTTLHDMRYNTFTTAFLNPIFVGLFFVGLAITLWRWRRDWMLAPLLIGIVMLFPNILSSEPYQPVRMVGVFLGLSLLVGFGAAELYRLPAKKLVGLAYFAILLGTPLYTGYHVWYHFNEQPLINDPHIPESLALKYRIGFLDMLLDIAESDTPTYLPMEYLNTDLAVAVLRPEYFPDALAYDGRDLPAGRVIAPRNDISYGFFFMDYAPVQYGLLLPETGEIIILPPLLMEDASNLIEETRKSGNEYYNEEGWLAGHQQTLPEDNLFDAIEIPVDDVIAVYDERLELVGIDAPEELIPGTIVPVTLYWRLRVQDRRDYFSRLQAWDFNNSNQGFERTSPLIGEADFPLNIHYNIYPTVMWDAGEIVADTRWLPISETAPEGGYRFALAVYGYPGLVPLSTTAPILDIWGMVGQSAIQPEIFASPAEIPDTGITLGGNYVFRDYELSIPSDELVAGDSLTTSVTWYVQESTHEGYITYLHVLDVEGNLIAQQDIQPFNGQFATWAWIPGTDVTLSYTVTIPEDAQAPFIVRTGMYSYPAIQPLEALNNGEPIPDNAIILE